MKKLLLILFISISFNTFGAYEDYFEIDFTLTEFCDDDPKVQYRGNYSQIFLPNQEKGISATSTCVYKDGYEQYRSKGNYVDGKKVGKHIAWYRNGQKSFEAFFIDGKPEGKWLNWFDNGEKYFESNYKNGKLEGKSFGWGKNGEILQEHSYKEGLKEGKAFLSSAFFDVEGNYKAGLPDGKWTWFSGGIWKEGFFAKGKLIGECNILMNSKNLKGNENFFLRIAEERNPGCDIDSIRVNTPYFSNGEWI